MALAAFMTALAFAAGGNPSTVSCNPDLPYTGYTWFDTREVQLSARVCGGLIYLKATPQERAKILSMNQYPAGGVDGAMAVAVVTVAHEAQHSAGTRGEGEAQCRAVQLAPGLLSRYLSGSDLDAATREVALIHATDPSAYKSVC